MNEIIGLVAVRSSSSRLKNKAFRILSGKPILEILIDRLKGTPYLDDFVICTGALAADDVIEEFCRKKGVKCFRGENENVLKRFIDASGTNPSEFVVRITGDNPLTDFITMHDCFIHLKKTGADYSRPEGVPIGTASEVIKTRALNELYQRSLTPELSEYMTYFFELAPFIKCDLMRVDESIYMPDLELTIDYEEDLVFVENLIKQFNGIIPSLEKIVGYCRNLKDYPRFVEDPHKANEIKSQIKFK